MPKTIMPENDFTVSETMTKDPEQRITELEISLAHVQRLYEQLNEVVTDQATEIDNMRRANKQLHDKVERLKSGGIESAVDPLDEKPPHY